MLYHRRACCQVVVEEDESEYNEWLDKEIIFWTEKSYKEELEDYNIDFSDVKDYWFDRYDEEREDLGLYSYTYSSKLEDTAFEWSNTQLEAGTAGHRRDPDDQYYDYDAITTWFSDRDVVCENRSWITHTENVGWGQFACTDWECTDELETAIWRTFDFFMSEKDDEYQPHYLSIVNKYFNYAWLWISVDEVSDNYYEFYLTVHYCTEFE